MIVPDNDSGQGQGGKRMISFQGAHFPAAMILLGERWYMAYPWRYRPRKKRPAATAGPCHYARSAVEYGHLERQALGPARLGR
jgi:hypothetical protein